MGFIGINTWINIYIYMNIWINIWVDIWIDMWIDIWIIYGYKYGSMGSNFIVPTCLLFLVVFQKGAIQMAHFCAAMLKENHFGGFHPYSSWLFSTLVLGAHPPLFTCLEITSARLILIVFFEHNISIECF